MKGLLVLGRNPLSASNRVSNSKISVSNPSFLSLKVPWMELGSEIYDWWLWTTSNWGRHSLYWMYQKDSATKLCHHPSRDSSARSRIVKRIILVDAMSFYRGRTPLLSPLTVSFTIKGNII